MSGPGGLERLERMLTLVPWLTSNPGVSLDMAAEQFGISVEQLEKDLWTLVVSGLPGHGPDQLIDIDFWDDGLIYVRDPQVLDVSMRLSPDESSALLVGLRLLAQVSDDGMRVLALQAADRIEAALGGSESGLVVDVEPSSEFRASLEVTMAQGRAVSIVYGDATADRVTSRIIWPQRVYSIDDVVYTEAFCEMAVAIRTFRLDRMRSVQPVDAVREPLPDSIPAADIAHDRLSQAALARIRFSPEVAWAADLHQGTTRDVGTDGSILAAIPYYDPEWLIGWVLSIGPGIVVLDPPELRRGVREAAEQALQALGAHRA